jgi:hypothetical protein
MLFAEAVWIALETKLMVSGVRLRNAPVRELNANVPCPPSMKWLYAENLIDPRSHGMNPRWTPKHHNDYPTVTRVLPQVSTTVSAGNL